MGRYEQYVRGELSKEAFRVALNADHEAKAVLAETPEQKAAYDKEYSIFHKLLSASDKRILLSEIMDCVEPRKSILQKPPRGVIMKEWESRN